MNADCLHGMKSMLSRKVRLKPASIRIDVSTICQLNCPTCPRKSIGAGFLKFMDFKKIMDEAPWINDVELSNWGEIFLNPDLGEIIEYGFKKKICLHAYNGVNLNYLREEIPELLVKYGFNGLTCSIDGASEQIYKIYRRGGNFEVVIENIKKINRYKKKYNSQLPFLRWQFVVFGHNEHEITKARQMAQELGMSFYLKLSGSTFSPVKNKELIRSESGTGAATREEYRQKFGRDYVRDICIQLWVQPAINFDGKVSGCCVNYWGGFGNVFEEGLLNILNSEKMNYARQMLLGEKKERSNIPCTACKIYQNIKQDKAWIKKSEIQPERLLKENIKKLLECFHLLNLACIVRDHLSKPKSR